MPNRATAVNPSVLRWARERAGLSLPEVAVRVNKDAAIIANWEAGTEAPTFNQLEDLAARLYKRPVALFFFPNPPDEEDARSQFRTLPESERDALAPDTRYALREALGYLESLREFTGDSSPARALITRDMRPGRNEDAVQFAGRVRSYLNVPLDRQSLWSGSAGALKQWRRSIEDAGVFVFKRSFKQESINGFCIHDEALPLIVINNSTLPSRQIFTLFHELGHLLHAVSGITKEDTGYIERLPGRAHAIEVFCNRFASEFLAPTPTFPWDDFRESDLDSFVQTQARRYNVSRTVILRKLLDRGLVDQGSYESKTAQWNLEFRRAREGRTGGGNYYATQASYLGESFLRLAFNQYYRGKVSLEQLAGHLRVKARNVARLEDYAVRAE
jgi:Zn-dependent peptidase ImmA (M78 family)/transcriptional regulator with XRE-family HTH domain